MSCTCKVLVEIGGTTFVLTSSAVLWRVICIMLVAVWEVLWCCLMDHMISLVSHAHHRLHLLPCYDSMMKVSVSGILSGFPRLHFQRPVFLHASITGETQWFVQEGNKTDNFKSIGKFLFIFKLVSCTFVKEVERRPSACLWASNYASPRSSSMWHVWTCCTQVASLALWFQGLQRLLQSWRLHRWQRSNE